MCLLAVFALALSACIFESDDNGLETWLSDQGMPSSYKVQSLSVDGINVASAKVFLDTFPKSADIRVVVGHSANLTHDMLIDFVVSDSNAIKAFKGTDSSGVILALKWLRPFYSAKKYPSDSLPFDEDVNMSISWKLESLKNSDEVDSVMEIERSDWYEDLTQWSASSSTDTTFKIKMNKGDSAILLELPSAFVASLKKMSGPSRLQMRFSAPEAKRVYRFYGGGTGYPPILALYTDSNNVFPVEPLRMANIVKNEEDCPECPVLHGGVYDSLVVELPPEPILKALSEFYGDEFPFTKGDSNDVRQTVILAELTMARNDADGSSELGLPIQVVVGSFVDSADVSVRRMENYRLNDDVILKEGHQNLVFHDGDSLKVQLTYGARDFVNKANDGRSMKFIMRLGYPFLQEKDTTYANYKTKDGDTSYVFFSYFDYARYDFASAMESPMTLKLWLASKRGDEE